MSLPDKAFAEGVDETVAIKNIQLRKYVVDDLDNLDQLDWVDSINQLDRLD